LDDKKPKTGSGPAGTPSNKDGKATVEEKTPVIEEDDDWGAVPAFLRRSKK